MGLTSWCWLSNPQWRVSTSWRPSTFSLHHRSSPRLRIHRGDQVGSAVVYPAFLPFPPPPPLYLSITHLSYSSRPIESLLAEQPDGPLIVIFHLRFLGPLEDWLRPFPRLLSPQAQCWLSLRIRAVCCLTLYVTIQQLNTGWSSRDRRVRVYLRPIKRAEVSETVALSSSGRFLSSLGALLAWSASSSSILRFITSSRMSSHGQGHSVGPSTGSCRHQPSASTTGHSAASHGLAYGGSATLCRPRRLRYGSTQGRSFLRDGALFGSSSKDSHGVDASVLGSGPATQVSLVSVHCHGVASLSLCTASIILSTTRRHPRRTSQTFAVGSEKASL